MTALERINGQVIRDTSDGAIYVGYDERRKELYAGYVAGNSAIAHNWTIKYDQSLSLDSQLVALTELIDANPI